MPKNSPRQSFDFLRNYIEKWQWRDPRTGCRVVGYNPPKDAVDATQMPYHIRYVTLKGRLEEGYCITLKANPRRRQHMIKFVESGEVRIINDFLVLEVDGTIFYA